MAERVLFCWSRGGRQRARPPPANATDRVREFVAVKRKIFPCVLRATSGAPPDERCARHSSGASCARALIATTRAHAAAFAQLASARVRPTRGVQRLRERAGEEKSFRLLYFLTLSLKSWAFALFSHNSRARDSEVLRCFASSCCVFTHTHSALKSAKLQNYKNFADDASHTLAPVLLLQSERARVRRT